MGAGDELKLKHTCAGPLNKAWQGIGIVIRLDEASEEVLSHWRHELCCLVPRLALTCYWTSQACLDLQMLDVRHHADWLHSIRLSGL